MAVEGKPKAAPELVGVDRFAKAKQSEFAASRTPIRCAAD
jgi:hypothetical protein